MLPRTDEDTDMSEHDRRIMDTFMLGTRRVIPNTGAVLGRRALVVAAAPAISWKGLLLRRCRAEENRPASASTSVPGDGGGGSRS